ncbi:lipid-A-disaccharide synthase, partial [Bacteroidota bacterium]
DSDPEFRCWGGDKMETAGATLVKHYRDLAFMGFLEVILNLRTIIKNLRFCKNDIIQFNPDVLILVDYPGFNLRIAEYAFKKGIKVFYYISPQVWAWKQSRIKKIRRYVNKMFVILPFEKEFYAKYNYHVDFVGHPLMDAIDEELRRNDNDDFRARNNLDDRPIIAILPGSRKQEISRILPEMIKIIPEYQDFQFVIAGVEAIPESQYMNKEAKVVFKQTYELLKNAAAAIVTSGTATLETALYEVPEIVCYRGSLFSYLLAKKFIKIQFISLVNLIMNRAIIRELIQKELNINNLKQELDRILFDESYRDKIISDYKLLKNELGGKGASNTTAELIMKYME